MIIECNSCSRKFLVKDDDIPTEGRMVQCSYCSQKWLQAPTKIQSSVESSTEKEASVMEFEASDGRTYRFMGRQWAEVLRSGKIGLLAKSSIGAELNRRAGINMPKKSRKRVKKIEETEIESISKIIDPSSEQIDRNNEEKKGLGFFGYIFILIIIALSIIGVLKTFQKELLIYFPAAEYIFETLNNMLTIVKDLIKSY